VQAQGRVRTYDQQALKAAQDNDTTAYLEARARRNNEQGRRYDLARAVGLKECSKTPG
jgi:hypothetical protein